MNQIEGVLLNGYNPASNLVHNWDQEKQSGENKNKIKKNIYFIWMNPEESLLLMYTQICINYGGYIVYILMTWKPVFWTAFLTTHGDILGYIWRRVYFINFPLLPQPLLCTVQNYQLKWNVWAMESHQRGQGVKNVLWVFLLWMLCLFVSDIFQFAQDKNLPPAALVRGPQNKLVNL